jgi:hypothetical protein
VLSHRAEFGRQVQTLARLERQPFLQAGYRSKVPSDASGAEALAALRAAASQQSTAALGGHPCPEPVGPRAMQITGVECTFHSATSGNLRGKSEEPQDLRKAARVLSKRGCVNRRTGKLGLDSLPFRLDCPTAPRS